MANAIRTKTSIWTLDDKTDKWQGVCIECRGEKSQYTPSVLKNKGIKPCSVCTDMDMYDKASTDKKQ